MAGLYIHIPFCRSRCTYCAFYSTTDGAYRQRYVEAVAAEARQRPATDTVGTIYLGGGTPSQLTAAQLELLLSATRDAYCVADDAEVTIEANPDDVTEDLAESIVGLGFNRVSMGAQTFDDERLRFLHRRHTAAQVVAAVGRLRRAGIGNISIDLMYGFPGESLADWHSDVRRALDLDVEHLSAYCLTVEEGTQLYEQWGGLPPISEEDQRQMYELLCEQAVAAGYDHYEISNFARAGRRSRHNSSYWTGVPYTGLGAAAHSYDGQRRSWNVNDLQQYMVGIETGRRQYDYEELDADSRYNDRVMLQLRTSEGISLEQLRPAERSYLLVAARRYVTSGLLTEEAGRLRLSQRGLFVSDMIISDLMRVS